MENVSFEAGVTYDIVNPMFQGKDANGNDVGAAEPCQNFSVSIADASGNFGTVSQREDGSWKFVAGDEGTSGQLVYSGFNANSVAGTGGVAGTVGPDVIVAGVITATSQPA